GDLAELLAHFHGEAKRANAYHYVEEVEKQWNENLADLEPLWENFVGAETVSLLKDYGADFIERHRKLVVQRAEEGRIRDVHGDLHCEHVCFAPEGIQIFDCIEFSPQLRCCDLASEIAFLLMDLEVRGGGNLVQPFLTRYLELLRDPDLPVLLP